MADPADAPATKRDLAEFGAHLEARLEASLEVRLTEVKARLSEQIRDVQTELLKAFLPWQDYVRIQFRELEVNTGNSVQSVKERMSVIERRLGEIEMRLLLNPPAA